MGLFSKHKSPTPSYQSGPPPYSSQPLNNNYAPPSPPMQGQPVNPDTRQLLNGWISQYDPNSKRFFYVYTPTALRQWEHPADKPLQDSNRGENSSYLNTPQQQPYYGQQQPQRYYPQQQQGYQPQYSPQPVYAQQQQQSGRFGGMGGMSSGGGYGKMAAAGLGGGLLGFMIGDAVGDMDRPDIIENNYYDNDNFNDNNFDDGGFDMF